MNHAPSEVERRTQAALAEIRRLHGTPEAEWSVSLFVSHHVKELPSTYWQARCGVTKPTPNQVLDILVMKKHWGEDEDELEVFDFTLPGGVTQYVLTVHFDADGAIESVAMES